MKRNVAAVVFVLLCGMAGADELCYWDFDGNLECRTGECGKARIVGNVSFTEGISGQCLNFSGGGSNAVVFEGTENVANGLGQLTVSLWYKGYSTENPAWAPIVSKDGEDGRGWQIRYGASRDEAVFTVRGLSGMSGNVTGNVPIGDGQWHHVAGVYDGRMVYLYVNGRLEDVVEGSGPIGATNSPIVIGAKISGSPSPRSFSSGWVDELRIYDRALEFEQIQQLAHIDTFLGKRFMERYRKLNVYPIQFHRGAGIREPENTLECFEWAWALRAIPEADVRTTRDGVPVCFHDSDFKRVAPHVSEALIGKSIDELTWDQIKEIDVSAFRGKPGQRIPTFEATLQAMAGRPDRFIYLDYKQADLRVLADMVRQYGVEEQIIFTSKSHSLICDWKRLSPQSQTLMWMGGSQARIQAKLDYLRQMDFCGLTKIQFHYIQRDGGFNLTDSFILNAKKEFGDRGIILQILPWTIQDRAVLDRLVGMGIESFATDYPEEMLAAFRAGTKTK